ncbi:hypothetical protein V2G26_010752 [Clonostachys chloroleuca]
MYLRIIFATVASPTVCIISLLNLLLTQRVNAQWERRFSVIWSILLGFQALLSVTLVLLTWFNYEGILQISKGAYEILVYTHMYTTLCTIALYKHLFWIGSFSIMTLDKDRKEGSPVSISTISIYLTSGFLAFIGIALKDHCLKFELGRATFFYSLNFVLGGASFWTKKHQHSNPLPFGISEEAIIHTLDDLGEGSQHSKSRDATI